MGGGFWIVRCVTSLDQDDLQRFGGDSKQYYRVNTINVIRGLTHAIDTRLGSCKLGSG